VRKRLIIIPLSVFLILAIAYLLLPLAAEKITRQLLQEQGVTTRQLNIEHPGWNSLLIPEAAFELNQNSTAIKIQASKLLIRFNPIQLFTEKRLQQVSIDQLSADIQWTPQSQDSDSTSIALITPEQILNNLPVDQLTIKQYTSRFNLVDQFILASRGKASLDANSVRWQSAINLKPVQTSTSETLMPAAPDDQQALLNLNAQADSQNTITLQLSHAGNVLSENRLSLAIQAGTEVAEMSSSHRIDMAQLTQFTADMRIQALLKSLAIELPKLPEISGQIRFEGENRINLRQPSDKEWLEALSSHYRIDTSVQVQRPINEITRTTLNTQHQLLLEQGQLTLTTEKLSASLANIQLPTVQSQQIDAELQQPVKIQAALNELFPLPEQALPLLSIPAIQLKLSAAPLLLPQPAGDSWIIQSAPFMLSSRPFILSDGNITTDFSFPEINTQIPGQPTPVLNVNGQLEYTADHLKSRFRLQLKDSLPGSNPVVLRGTTHTRLKQAFPYTTGAWKMNDLSLKGIETVAKHYYPAFPPELIVQAGTLNHRGWFDLNQSGIALRFLNRIQEVDLSFDQTRLFGIQWQSETTRTHRGTTKDSGELKISFIDLGAPIEALSSSYQFNQRPNRNGYLTLNSSQAQLLGGMIHTLPVTINLNDPEVETAVALTHLDLAQIIALEQQPGLTGKGTLNGQMPLRYQQGRFSISDGQINSSPEGGWIRFDPPAEFLALTKANPSLSIAFDALRNLNYSSMGIKLNLAEDGTALLNTRLKGYNPDWNNSQPIDFSVNIEENIPTLIQTLQFTDKLTRSIEKRYR